MQVAALLPEHTTPELGYVRDTDTRGKAFDGAHAMDRPVQHCFSTCTLSSTDDVEPHLRPYFFHLVCSHRFVGLIPQASWALPGIP